MNQEIAVLLDQYAKACTDLGHVWEHSGATEDVKEAEALRDHIRVELEGQINLLTEEE